MATAFIPSSLQAQITRRAISPRFAMRIFLNMNYVGTSEKLCGCHPERICVASFATPYPTCELAARRTLANADRELRANTPNPSESQTVAYRTLPGCRC